MFQLLFGNEQSSATWYTIYGGGPNLDAKGFALESTRGIPDVFMNTHNAIVALLLGYNNNVTSGNRDLIYYVTLYNTKGTQDEERFPFMRQCVAIAKRMSRLRQKDNEVQNSLDSFDANTM
jgi:hypothetical protein